MNPIEKAIERIEEVINEASKELSEKNMGIFCGASECLDILREELTNTAMVDVYSEGEKTSGKFCCCRCDMFIEYWANGRCLHYCSSTNETLDMTYDNCDLDKKPDWCPAYVTKGE